MQKLSWTLALMRTNLASLIVEFTSRGKVVCFPIAFWL